MDISYDPVKDGRNIEDRGISFESARQFDFETALYRIEDRRDYGERRVQALGLLRGRLHMLVFCETASGIRIISLRKANAREVRKYEEAH
jgi:uncharacterized protein